MLLEGVVLEVTGPQGRVAKLLELTIPCPHCRVGFVTVTVEDKGVDRGNYTLNEMVVGGLTEPHQCSSCKGYARVHVNLQVTLSKFEPQKVQPTSGEIVKSLIGA